MIKRYEMGLVCSAIQKPDGPWVKFEDHEREVKELQSSLKPTALDKAREFALAELLAYQEHKREPENDRRTIHTRKVPARHFQPSAL